MKKFFFNLKLCFIAFALCLVGASDAFADTKTGTITFGTPNVKINDTEVTGKDDLGNTWTVTTVITTPSFTQNASYSQVGAAKKPATSITFATSLPKAQTIKSFSAKFGGFSDTKGDVTLTVGGKTVGSGSLNATEDVTVSSTSVETGTELTITVTNIAKGVKVYYITYTYEEAGSGQPVKELSSISVSGTPVKFWLKDAFNHTGMSVTATYSDNSSEDVTEDAEFSTPDMKSAGEKEVTVAYGGKTTSYKIKVQTIANTKETAYTTAEAKTLIDAGKDLATSVYVKGVVSQVDKFTEKNKTLTYWLDENTFEVYNGKNTAAGGFASADDVKVGASVIVYGTITYYEKGKVYEFNSSSELVEYNGAEPVVTNVAPSFTTQPVATKSYKMGDTAKNLTIAVAGTPEPTLQWYVNIANTTEGGVAIDGATSTTYKPSIKELGTKYYYCVATNSEGSVASKISAVSVKDESSITLNGNLTKLFLGDEDTYTVETIGDGVLTVTSKDANVATATLDGNKVTIKTLKAGSSVIYFNLAETDNYKATTKSYTLNVTELVPASLDFTFGGGKAAVKEEDGMSHNGLGSDYSASPKLKFDDTNDYMMIAFNDEPGKLNYTVKNNGFSGGTFDVLESADNKAYTIVKSHTTIEGSQKESVSLKSTSRFVKFVYTEKKSGNVGLGGISITKKEAEPEIADAPVTTADDGAAAWATSTYTREVATGKLSTICLPYDATVEGAIVYTLDGKVSKGGKVKSLNFVLAGDTENESNVLEAGVPYVYKATADKQTFTKTGSASSKVSPKAGLDGFVGTYSDFMLPVGDFFLRTNGGKQEFCKAGDYGDGKSYIIVRAFKCYISSIDDIRETSASTINEASRRFVIGTWTDEATGITTLDTDSVEPADGKYIEGGRVVVVKNGVKYNINGQRIK